MLRMPGWVGLTDEALETKSAPFKISARKHWDALKKSATLDEHQRLAVEQEAIVAEVKVGRPLPLHGAGSLYA